MERQQKPKIVITKMGLDGHERGARVIAKQLINLGMEVVYLGMYQTPKSVVKAVLEENADVLGISYHSGLHLEFTRKIIDLLENEGIKNDLLLLVGGIIPSEDIGPLKNMGVDEVYPSGSLVQSIGTFILENT